jgi:PTH1 family peptidyl-tRNA hydrolase
VKLVVGLGNPGVRYHHTRHNLGFLAIDHFAGKYAKRDASTKRFWQRLCPSNRKYNSVFFEGVCCGEEFVAIKPETFMNRSGEAVRAFAAHYRLTPEQVIILCDDVHLHFGYMRIRASGSSGGHNGLRSVAECLESDAFMRLRLGVGAPEGSGELTQSLADYVLSPFSEEEMERIPTFLEYASEALALLIQGNTNKAMNACHGRDCTQA